MRYEDALGSARETLAGLEAAHAAGYDVGAGSDDRGPAGQLQLGVEAIRFSKSRLGLMVNADFPLFEIGDRYYAFFGLGAYVVFAGANSTQSCASQQLIAVFMGRMRWLVLSCLRELLSNLGAGRHRELLQILQQLLLAPWATMNRRKVLGALTMPLAVACGGDTVTDADDPDAGNGSGGGAAGETTGSMTSGGTTGDSSGGAGGSAAGETTGSVTSSGGVGNSSGGTAGDSSGGSGGAASGGGGEGGTDGSGPARLPCDVLEADGHACVAAHSTVRLLRSAYDGPLYRVCGGPANAGPSSCQGETLDIGVVAGGYADAAAQEAFCATGCTIAIVYDQSGQGNHLEPAPPGGAKPTPGNPVDADALPTSIAGNDVYGMFFRPGMGYRTGCSECNVETGNGMPLGDEPETIYMVTSQHDLINGCCFDYGNAEVTSNNDGNGASEAVYFGQGVIWGTGTGEGPWVMADLENGLYPGWENGQERNISTNTSLTHDFVTAILVGDTADKNESRGRFALYGGDAQAGELTTLYDGIRPEKPGYVPMQKQGSIVLSVAGDNSDGDGGRFYEGVIASGAASKQTLDALQAAIVAAGYGN